LRNGPTGQALCIPFGDAREIRAGEIATLLASEMNMRTTHKLHALMAVLACALFSLPGVVAAKGSGNNGTGKAYSLVMHEHAPYNTNTVPRSVNAPVMVQALLKNEAPPGDAASNIGSWELTITNPGVTIYAPPGDAGHQPSGATVGVIIDDGGVVIGGVVNGTATVVADANGNNMRIVVTNMAPLKAKQTYALTFYVTSCGDALWDANVRAGASLSGDSFTRTGDSVDASTGLAINLQTLISCGTLACGNSVVLVADKASLSPELVVTRGPYNSDGSCSNPSDFFASNKLLTADGQVHFRWPVGPADQALGVWAYNVVSTNDTMPKLAWVNVDDSKASAAFPNANSTTQVPAYLDGSILPCKDPNGNSATLASIPYPKPYGVLSNNANQSTLTIKVNTSPQNAVLPTPTTPFDIVIGTERMRVTSAQGSTWTVEARGAGMTTPAPHAAGSKLMSTPLPLLPESGYQATYADGVTVVNPTPSHYAFGRQAQMCIVGAPTEVLPATDPPTYSTTIIDLSDGFVRVSNQ